MCNPSQCLRCTTLRRVCGLTAFSRQRAVAQQGYSKLLGVLGSSFGEFLRNLNNLHLHLSMSFEAMIAPAFRCEKVRPMRPYALCVSLLLTPSTACLPCVPTACHLHTACTLAIHGASQIASQFAAPLQVTPESLELHYMSKRPGLWPLLVGVLHGMAEDYFDIKIEVELLRGRDDGTCDHEVLFIKHPRQVRARARPVAVK